MKLSASTDRSASETKTTVGVVLSTVGPPALRMLTPAYTGDAQIQATFLLDPTEPLPDGPDTLVLASGIRVSSPAAAELIDAAARRGYCGVVLKCRGEPVEHLASLAADRSMALLIADDAVPWRHLDGLILSVLGSRGGNGRTVAGAGEELFALANATAAVCGGSVAIEDLDRRVLAYSSLPDQRIDELRRQGILQRQVPAMSRHLRQYAAVLEVSGVVRFTAEEVGTPRAAIAIRAGNQPLGTIWAIEDSHGSHTARDRALTDASTLAALHLLRRQNSTELGIRAREDSLRAALEGHLPVHDIAFRLGIPGGAEIVLLAFALASDATGPAAIAQLAAALTRYFAVFHTDAAVCATSQAVYVLVVRDGARAASRLAQGAVTSLPDDMAGLTRVAVPDVTSDAQLLPMLRRDADDILRATLDSRTVSPVATIADARAQVVLVHVSEMMQRSKSLQHPGVNAMLASDHDKRTEFARSVLAWAESAGDVAEAALALGIHANSLRYRLRRVQKLFGIRLDDPDTRLHVWLQLRTRLPSLRTQPPI